MSIKSNIAKKSSNILEMIKWFSIFTLFITSIVGNYLCCNCSILLRMIVITLIFFIAMYVISITRIGRLLVIFGQESRVELKQVMWPTYRDGLNITLVVVAVTIVVSLILWGLDAIIVNVIAFGLRL